MSVNTSMQGNKSKQHLLNVFLQESVMNEVHELAELAIENGANLHKENGDALIKEALLSNNEAMVSLLIKHETLITPESAEKAIGFYRCGDISKKSALNIIKYIDWKCTDKDISIISLILAVYFKPVPEIKAEVERYFDFKDYIVSKDLFIGVIFDYIRSDSNFGDVVELLDNLPVDRFGFTHDISWEKKIKKSLVRARQFVALDYLNKRGALATGLKFDEYYHGEAAQISEMFDAGYDVECAWDIHVFFRKDIQPANLFNPLPEKVAKLKAQLRFMLPLSEVEDKEACLQKMAELVNTHAVMEEKIEESPKPMIDLYEALNEKGYFKGLKLELANIGECGGDDDDTALFIRLLRSSKRCWQSMTSGDVTVDFDTASLNELSVDFDAATSWLSQFPYDHEVFLNIEQRLLDRPLGGTLNLLDLLIWNIDRLDNRNKVRVETFDRLKAYFKHSTHMWNEVRESIFDDETNGFHLFLVYLSDEREMMENLMDITKENGWRKICRVCKKGPMHYINMLPKGHKAEVSLLSLLADN